VHGRRECRERGGRQCAAHAGPPSPNTHVIHITGRSVKEITVAVFPFVIVARARVSCECALLSARAPLNTVTGPHPRVEVVIVNALGLVLLLPNRVCAEVRASSRLSLVSDPSIARCLCPPASVQVVPLAPARLSLSLRPALCPPSQPATFPSGPQCDHTRLSAALVLSPLVLRVSVSVCVCVWRCRCRRAGRLSDRGSLTAGTRWRVASLAHPRCYPSPLPLDPFHISSP